ncbi:MAG TPA: hypothetical protein VFC09_16655 [Candidatus Dormibacteraeota bacterium]|nr:hypothetical protein [Candidatus Dormibacteraeota bacterium]
MRRAAVLLGLAAVIAALGGAVVSAGQSPVFIDTPKVTLSAVGGGGWTASLDFTNLTNASVKVTAATPGAHNTQCTLGVKPQQLPPAQHSAVTVTVPAACDVGADGITFTVRAGSASFTIIASNPDAGAPDWLALWAFAGAFAAALLLSVILLVVLGCAPWRELKGLEKTWSFSESWVSNITIVGGLVTGVFGSSSVVKALGSGADSAVALATVGAAIAAALIAAGGILVLATKREGEITAGGLLAACSLTAAGAAGELYAVFDSGRFLSLGGWQDRLVYPLAVALALLGVYVVRAMIETLTEGKKDPAPPQESDMLTAADRIVAALRALQPEGQRSVFDDALRETSAFAFRRPPDEGGAVEAAAPVVTRRRRTALL